MLKIKFEFEDGSSITKEFDELDISDSEVGDYAEDKGQGAHYTYSIEEYDEDYGSPEEYSDFDEYCQVCQDIEEYGEAAKLRWEDVGSFDSSQYEGCWHDEEEFAENFADDVMEIPSNLAAYFDYEKFARDLMMDYSSYEGSEGLHVFRD